MSDRFISPVTGNDANSGASLSLAWATLENARSYINSNPGVVSRLFIDTRTNPLYITTGYDHPVGTDDLLITSFGSDLADIRGYLFVAGSTAVSYDSRYHAGVPTHPNLWVFVNSITNAKLKEHDGGVGDDLIQYDHVIRTGACSTTYNNATNLDFLDNNSFTFWTGSDGSVVVTIFNPGSSPVGRNFTLSRTAPIFTGGTGAGARLRLENLLVGGVGGVSNAGVAQPSYPVQLSEDAILKNSRLYDGGTHHLFLGKGNCIVEDVELGVGPGYFTAGGYTPIVSYSGGSNGVDMADLHTYRRVRSVPSFGIRGTKIGSIFDRNNDLINDYFSHGAGTIDAISIENCNLAGGIQQSSDGGTMVPVVTVKDTICASVSLSPTVALTMNVDRSKLTVRTPAITNTSSHTITLTDCLIQARRADYVANGAVRVRGNLTFRRCTIFVSESTYATKVFLDRFGGTLNLNIESCIINLVGAGGNWNVVRNTTIPGGDTLAFNYNVWRTENGSHAILNSHNDGSTTTNRTFANMQTLGYEVNGRQTTDLKLNSTNYRPNKDSPAVNNGQAYNNTRDYSGSLFVTRNDAGAFEYTPSKSNKVRLGNRLSISI